MDKNEFHEARPYLTTRKINPENQESPIHFIDSPTTSNKLFYRRNHFSYPNGVSTALDQDFNGPFQAIDYVYYPNKKDDSGKIPVTLMNVNSTIQQPLNSTGRWQPNKPLWNRKGYGNNAVDKIRVKVE